MSKKRERGKSGKDRVEGLVKRHADGFGFLIPDEAGIEDIYVPAHNMIGIMTNDRISVKVKRKGHRFWGDEVAIVSRQKSHIVGHFRKQPDGSGRIGDESKAWGGDLFIARDHVKGARDGDWVSVQITRYPGKEGARLEGEVISVIGDVGDPLNDIKRVLSSSAIPQHFVKETLAESAEIAKRSEISSQSLSKLMDPKWRRDLRGLCFITIDGTTAKDFDDAICVKLEEKGFRLWVAIADVSHYVKEGSALDREASDRGNSTYFPNFVVPMLPEELSNDLCSLRPNEPRLVMAAEMTIGFDGVVGKSQFYEGVIESRSRVTYGEAQEVIDQNPERGAERGAEKRSEVQEVILLASDLAKVLMAKRFREGSLELEIPETEVIVGEDGHPVDIIRSERLFSHKLIEELMLVANVSVARFLSEKESPSLYRIHEAPFMESISMLERFLHNFGFTRQIRGGKLQTKITKALQRFEGKPEGKILNILALRSMTQAKYSPNNIGHFGLGFSHYTHFTSPIRRYADLVVHRLLKHHLGYRGYRLIAEGSLYSLGTNLSACEQRSVKAERQLQSIKKARFMSRHLGEEFEGIISSVAKFGIFVLLRQFDLDGLVKVESLGKERFEFDEESLTLNGKRSGVIFQMGDEVRVQVAATNTELGQIDFVLVSPNS